MTGSLFPRWASRRRWTEILVYVVATLLPFSGWYMYFFHPRLLTGVRIETVEADRARAAISPLVPPLPDPRRASTGAGQTRTFALPGESTIQLGPSSEFTYSGKWSPEMTGILHGEGLLVVAQGSSWTIYASGGSMKVGPGRGRIAQGGGERGKAYSLGPRETGRPEKSESERRPATFSLRRAMNTSDDMVAHDDNGERMGHRDADDAVTNGGMKSIGSDQWTLRQSVTDQLEDLLKSAAALPPNPERRGDNEAWKYFYDDFHATHDFILTRYENNLTSVDPEEEAALAARADIDDVRRRLDRYNALTARVFRGGAPAVILDMLVTSMEKTVADYRDRANRIEEYWEQRLYGSSPASPEGGADEQG